MYILFVCESRLHKFRKEIARTEFVVSLENTTYVKRKNFKNVTSADVSRLFYLRGHRRKIVVFLTIEHFLRRLSAYDFSQHTFKYLL